jgi:hypothetical protein
VTEATGLDDVLRRVAAEKGWAWCYAHHSPRFDGASTCAALHEPPPAAGELPPFGPPRRRQRVRELVERALRGRG